MNDFETYTNIVIGETVTQRDVLNKQQTVAESGQEEDNGDVVVIMQNPFNPF